MFKWLCLAVAVVALGVLGWMVNDMRLEVKQNSQTLNRHLPSLLDRTDRVVRVLDRRLPELLERTEKIAGTFAELSEDVRQLKELWAGMNAHVRDKGLVAYANSLLTLLERQEGVIGLKKRLGGKGLKSTQPVKEWVAGARKEAFFLTFLVRSRTELLNRLCKNKFGSPWYIEPPGQEPVPLRDWLKRHHPESKDL